MVVPLSSTLIDEGNTAVPLELYAYAVGYPPNAFFGVLKSDEFTRYCDRVWLKSERDTMAFYLAEAQAEIEAIVRYPLAPTWYANEDHKYKYPIVSKWGKVIAAGVRAETVISDSEAVSHATDPVVLTVATSVTEESEVKVYHEDLDIEIVPSDISFSGGNVEITIPRHRLVKPSLVDNPEEGLDYATTANFVDAVDIKRVYNDPSTNATLVWAHTCGGSTCVLCSEYTQTGCMYLKDAENGTFEIVPATYSSGSWASSVSCCTGRPDRVKINYYAGLTQLTKQARDTIIMLAHAKMPSTPCGCEQVTRLWKRDRNIPGVLTKERINCPFGVSDGAWVAWRFTQVMRRLGMGII
jgi:hypothetical protein